MNTTIQLIPAMASMQTKKFLLAGFPTGNYKVIVTIRRYLECCPCSAEKHCPVARDPWGHLLWQCCWAPVRPEGGGGGSPSVHRSSLRLIIFFLVEERCLWLKHISGSRSNEWVGPVDCRHYSPGVDFPWGGPLPCLRLLCVTGDPWCPQKLQPPKCGFDYDLIDRDVHVRVYGCSQQKPLWLLWLLA